MKKFKKTLSAIMAVAILSSMASCAAVDTEESETSSSSLTAITFGNPTESTEIAPVIAGEGDDSSDFERSVYTPLIDAYCDISETTGAVNVEPYTLLGIADNGIANYETALENHFNLIVEKGSNAVGYSYIDLNDDGVVEFVVGDGNVVYAIYTYVNDAILPIALGDSSTVYYIGSDDYIYSEYDSGTLEKAAAKYYIGSTYRLFMVEELREHSETGNESDLKYYISNTGGAFEYNENFEVPHENYLGPLLGYTDVRTVYTIQIFAAYR